MWMRQAIKAHYLWNINALISISIDLFDSLIIHEIAKSAPKINSLITFGNWRKKKFKVFYGFIHFIECVMFLICTRFPYSTGLFVPLN